MHGASTSYTTWGLIVETTIVSYKSQKDSLSITTQQQEPASSEEHVQKQNETVSNEEYCLISK